MLVGECNILANPTRTVVLYKNIENEDWKSLNVPLRPQNQDMIIQELSKLIFGLLLKVLL